MCILIFIMFILCKMVLGINFSMFLPREVCHFIILYVFFICKITKLKYPLIFEMKLYIGGSVDRADCLAETSRWSLWVSVCVDEVSNAFESKIE